MAKRGADKYLTDQNWDKDEDADVEEQTGSFLRADDEVLKKRVIRKAKRRVVDKQSSSASAFAGFSGLTAPSNKTGFQGFTLPGASKNGNPPAFKGLTPSGNTNSSPFQLHTTSTATDKPLAVFTNTQSSMKPVFPTKVEATQPSSKPISSVKLSDEDEISENSKEYNRFLSALNRNVSEWIRNHVEKNPLCDLTPVFRDYQKHLSDIDEKFGQSDPESSQSFAVSDSQETVSPKSSKNSSRASPVAEKPKPAVPSFGSAKPEPAQYESKITGDLSSSKPLPSLMPQSVSSSPFKGFNIPNKSAPAFPGFSFNASAPQKEAVSESKTEEEYVPPKPESNVHVEDDAFFSIRCKLYYKKGESYADRGVGQLYLKPIGEKTQLLVRADTAISQILLNIMLQPSIPLVKQGKNNVMITCIPNPPIDEKEASKITPMLIRVKTSDDADKLLKIMKEKCESMTND